MIRRFARPYARAIMDVVGSPEKADALRYELARFDQARKASPELQELYANPGIEPDQKLQITKSIAKRLGLSDMAVRVLDVLTRNHRMNGLDAVVEAAAAVRTTIVERKELAAQIEDHDRPAVELGKLTRPRRNLGDGGNHVLGHQSNR